MIAEHAARAIFDREKWYRIGEGDIKVTWGALRRKVWDVCGAELGIWKKGGQGDFVVATHASHGDGD